ncbi:MAG: hypothetical protein ABW169_12290 [Sphingobium sp.]
MTPAIPDQGAPSEAAPPDAHGEAALLLVESLIHGLIDRGILDVGAAIDVVDTAVSVEEDVMDARPDRAGVHSSLDLLVRIARSLSMDLPQT